MMTDIEMDRRFAAARLESMANDSLAMGLMSFQMAVAECIGVDGGWSELMQELADLIDPTCTDFGGSVPGMSAFECSRCGAVLNVGGGGGLRTAGHYYDDAPNGPIAYCPNCGARVVRSDDVSAHQHQ